MQTVVLVRRFDLAVADLERRRDERCLFDLKVRGDSLLVEVALPGVKELLKFGPKFAPKFAKNGFAVPASVLRPFGAVEVLAPELTAAENLLSRKLRSRKRALVLPVGGESFESAICPLLRVGRETWKVA